MRIGVNALFFIPGKHGGTETYLRNLFLSLSMVDKENEYILFTNRENSGNFGIIKQDNFSEVLCNFPARFKLLRVFYEQMILPIMAKRYEIDVLHSPSYVSPVWKYCGAKLVVTIHDMMYKYYPENYPRGQLFYYRNFIPASARKAEKIIAVSNNTKKDIISILRITESKVKVIYEAPDGRFRSDLSDAEKVKVRRKYNLPERFILSVASFNPHKNIDGLVRAFNVIKGNHGALWKLVLLGWKLPYFSKIVKVIGGLGLSRDVLFTGYVPDEELPYIYSLADLYVFPSFFEGFGLPPLEAMACGCPVVAANTTSIPEVVGDAGVLVDPHDFKGMAQVMVKLLMEDSLRDDLINRGLGRVKLFSWEKTAKETLKVYEEVARQR